ncbi:uncharacterized protein Dwil_GK17396 [Drosophila willistoni]|uniref:Gamma-tubulin complex component n=1 Tax=Drosophila willistoni TaxID=7260 RepID=B4MLU9_DROWI|nr:gamma-tubulin complex component 2 homolog [Drosophila willistoni]EDW73160.1 uncharacterized protein Dwil_GK17396 [Drosophila willistoni]
MQKSPLISKMKSNSVKLVATTQERLLIQDLITALLGDIPIYIRTNFDIQRIAHPDELWQVHFEIDTVHFSGEQRALINDFLPMMAYQAVVHSYIYVIRFKQCNGRAQWALASLLSKELHRYFAMLWKLQKQYNEKKLSLQKVVEQLSPWLPIMNVYCGIAGYTQYLNLNSVQLINRLDEFYDMNDFSSNLELNKRLCQMIKQVSAFYMESIQMWTQKGSAGYIENEFFISDMAMDTEPWEDLSYPEQCSNLYWDQRYRLHVDRLPNFLMDHANIIFLSGKYLNILKQCNVAMTLIDIPLTYQRGDLSHIMIIQRSYELAAKSLKDFLVNDHELLFHLNNLRLYGLLQEKSFAKNLMKKLNVYLEAKVSNLKLEELQGQLVKVLHKCGDSFKDLMRIQLKDCSLLADDIGYDQLCGYDIICLNYEVKWPLSLVLNSERLGQMQVLQRVVLCLRYVQYKLEKLNSSTTSSNDPLYTHMLQSFQGLFEYMSMTIESRWREFLDSVLAAVTIDQVVSAFKNTLDQSIEVCLSTGPDFVRYVLNIARTCIECLKVQELANKGGDETKEASKPIIEYYKQLLLCMDEKGCI